MAMNPDELRAAILAGEGREVEFKRGLPSDYKVARSLCAFANTRGGLLFIGVGDRGELEGAPHPDAVLRTLREVGLRRVSPPLEPLLESVSIDGVRLVVARIGASRQRPHSVLRESEAPEVVVRSGSSNRVASKATVAALHSARRSRSTLDELERSVLDYVDSFGESEPNGGATIPGFARARNIGAQRAKRTFLRLEREGFVLGIGVGSTRRFRAF
jgi:predicted HTH transcriptional regulator